MLSGAAIAGCFIIGIPTFVLVIAWVGEIIGGYRFFCLKRNKGEVISRLRERHPDFDSKTCPTPEEIERYVWGCFAFRRQVEIFIHLEDEKCSKCRLTARKILLYRRSAKGASANG